MLLVCDVLRPTPHRLSSEMNTYKIVYVQTGFVSGGDPPMLKSEKEVGEQELNVNSSRVLAQRPPTSSVLLFSFYR